MRKKTATLPLVDTRLWWSLAVLAIVLSFFYVYLVNNSVFNIAARKNNEEKIASLEAQVATLESSYMAESGQINLQMAGALGFVDSSKETNYAVLNHSAVSQLSLSNEI